MFIKTIKVKKPTFAVIGAVLAALALLAVIIVTVVRISSPAVYEMKSEAQRQAFLKEMGWEVSDEYDECKAVTIPKEFNEVHHTMAVLLSRPLCRTPILSFLLQDIFLRPF